MVLALAVAAAVRRRHIGPGGMVVDQLAAALRRARAPVRPACRRLHGAGGGGEGDIISLVPGFVRSRSGRREPRPAAHRSQGGPDRALSACARRSASTDDDDARGAAGWPRGESCHAAHGTLLRVRLRHRTRTHGGSLGAAVARAAWKGARAHLLARPQSTPPLRQPGAIQRLRVGKGYHQAAGGGDARGAAK